MGKTCKILSSIKYTIFIFFIYLFNSCNTPEKRVRTKEQALIKNVSILISGRGREMVGENINIHEDLSREIYLIELSKDGLLKTSLGYGIMISIENSQRNDLKLNLVKKIDSVQIAKTKLKDIFNLASKIHTKRTYNSKSIFLDSWLIKLKINNKTNIFFLGETAGLFKKLTIEYLKIVDELVEVSPISVREYR